jgi:hypothetical protein
MSNLPALIQAGAAIVQAIAAIVIYKVTHDYVGLTRDIAKASGEQVKLMRLTQLADGQEHGRTLVARAATA